MKKYIDQFNQYCLKICRPPYKTLENYRPEKKYKNFPAIYFFSDYPVGLLHSYPNVISLLKSLRQHHNYSESDEFSITDVGDINHVRAYIGSGTVIQPVYYIDHDNRYSLSTKNTNESLIGFVMNSNRDEPIQLQYRYLDDCLKIYENFLQNEVFEYVVSDLKHKTIDAITKGVYYGTESELLDFLNRTMNIYFVCE